MATNYIPVTRQPIKKSKIAVVSAIIIIIVAVIMYLYSNQTTTTNNNVILPALSPSSSVVNPYTNIFDGYDFPGSDIKYYEGSWDNCPNECSNTPGCVGYVRNVSNGKDCWLKSRFGPTFTANRARVSFTKPIRNYKAQVNFDYPGNDILYYTGPLSTCGLMCDNTPGCVGYATNKDTNNNCWLKSKFGTGAASTNRDNYILQ